MRQERHCDLLHDANRGAVLNSLQVKGQCQSQGHSKVKQEEANIVLFCFLTQHNGFS